MAPQSFAEGVFDQKKFFHLFRFRILFYWIEAQNMPQTALFLETFGSFTLLIV